MTRRYMTSSAASHSIADAVFQVLIKPVLQKFLLMVCSKSAKNSTTLRNEINSIINVRPSVCSTATDDKSPDDGFITVAKGRVIAHNISYSALTVTGHAMYTFYLK
jgi:hypothetical protein